MTAVVVVIFGLTYPCTHHCLRFSFPIIPGKSHPNKGGNYGPTFEEFAAQLWFSAPAAVGRQNHSSAASASAEAVPKDRTDDSQRDGRSNEGGKLASVIKGDGDDEGSATASIEDGDSDDDDVASRGKGRGKEQEQEQEEEVCSNSNSNSSNSSSSLTGALAASQSRQSALSAERARLMSRVGALEEALMTSSSSSSSSSRAPPSFDETATGTSGKKKKKGKVPGLPPSLSSNEQATNAWTTRVDNDNNCGSSANPSALLTGIGAMSAEKHRHQHHEQQGSSELPRAVSRAVSVNDEIEALSKLFTKPAILRVWKKRARLMPRQEPQVLRSIDM